jgi:hypothetical protein
MHLSGYTKKLLALAQTLHRWAGALGALDLSRREKVAKYADEIAATLARASGALLRLEADATDHAATREALRESAGLRAISRRSWACSGTILTDES